MRRSCARHRESAKRRVELVESGSAGEWVDRNGEPIRLALPTIDCRGQEVVLGQAVSVTESVNRGGGIVDGLVPCREDGDERVSGHVARSPGTYLPAWFAVLAVFREEEREAGSEQVVCERLDYLDKRQVDVSGICGCKTIDFEERGDAGCHLRPDRCRYLRHVTELCPAIFGGGDAVELVPARVERTPQPEVT